MNTLELRTNFHNLIDSINNDRILSKFYSIMVSTKENNDGILWARLSKEEQDELIQADIDSYDPMNLIPQNEIMEKHKKWL
jgi:hypothetical protein